MVEAFIRYDAVRFGICENAPGMNDSSASLSSKVRISRSFNFKRIKSRLKTQIRGPTPQQRFVVVVCSI